MKHGSRLGPLMMRKAPETRYAFDYDDVAPDGRPVTPDMLGLSADDRRALGLAAPRIEHAAPTIQGDAVAALREILASGGAMGKVERRR